MHDPLHALMQSHVVNTRLWEVHACSISASAALTHVQYPDSAVYICIHSCICLGACPNVQNYIGSPDI